jgi:hypothetical protein
METNSAIAETNRKAAPLFVGDYFCVFTSGRTHLFPIPYIIAKNISAFQLSPYASDFSLTLWSESVPLRSESVFAPQRYAFTAERNANTAERNAFTAPQNAFAPQRNANTAERNTITAERKRLRCGAKRFRSTAERCFRAAKLSPLTLIAYLLNIYQFNTSKND